MQSKIKIQYRSGLKGARVSFFAPIDFILSDWFVSNASNGLRYVPKAMMAHLVSRFLPLLGLVYYSATSEHENLSVYDIKKMVVLTRRNLWPYKNKSCADRLFRFVIQRSYDPYFLMQCLNYFSPSAVMFKHTTQRLMQIIQRLEPKTQMDFFDRINDFFKISNTNMDAFLQNMTGVTAPNFRFVAKEIKSIDVISLSEVRHEKIIFYSHTLVKLEGEDPEMFSFNVKGCVHLLPRVLNKNYIQNSIIIFSTASCVSPTVELDIFLRVMSALENNIEQQVCVLCHPEVGHRLEPLLKKVGVKFFEISSTSEVVAEDSQIQVTISTSAYLKAKALAEATYAMPNFKKPLVVTSTFHDFSKADYKLLHERWPVSDTDYVDIALYDPLKIIALFGAHSHIIFGTDLPVKYNPILNLHKITLVTKRDLGPLQESFDSSVPAWELMVSRARGEILCL